MEPWHYIFWPVCGLLSNKYSVYPLWLSQIWIFFNILGCFRYGTGLNFNSNILEECKTNTALECREICRANSKCKLFHWNQDSKNCFSRSEIPNDINVFISVKFAIVGLTDCSDVSLLWPEYKHFFTSPSTQNTTTIIPKMYHKIFANAHTTTTNQNASIPLKIGR